MLNGSEDEKRRRRRRRDVSGRDREEEEDDEEAGHDVGDGACLISSSLVVPTSLQCLSLSPSLNRKPGRLCFSLPNKQTTTTSSKNASQFVPPSSSLSSSASSLPLWPSRAQLERAPNSLDNWLARTKQRCKLKIRLESSDATIRAPPPDAQSLL